MGQCFQKSAYTVEEGGQEREAEPCSVITEPGSEALNVENMVMSQVGASRSWKRQGPDSPLEPPEGASSADTWMEALRPICISDHKNCNGIHLLCFKLLDLWLIC